jgi:hypothetical protein
VSLIAETGSGALGAASYASVARADAYWAERAHSALATAWADADTPQKEGALREATAFLDATYGPHYRGDRRGYVQGLLWPRTNALDEAGYPLPDLPREVVDAVCELAVRALTAPLALDVMRGGQVTRLREKVGPIEEETEWAGGAPVETSYGAVGGLMAQVCRGTQAGASTATWFWR